MGANGTAAGFGAEVKERLIVALDVPSADEAISIVRELSGEVGAFKIGSQLFTAAGPDLVRRIAAMGERVFLDLKFHDIPNTVAAAAVEAARLGVWMLNVHAAGGREMMESAREAVAAECERSHIPRPLLIAVTVLTSSDDGTLNEAGVAGDVNDQVSRLANLARASGFDGVVASANEAAMIRPAVGNEFIIVTPGIRPANATIDDQKRVMTFGQAVAAGIDFAVVGRPIIGAADRLAAVREILSETIDQ